MRNGKWAIFNAHYLIPIAYCQLRIGDCALLFLADIDRGDARQTSTSLGLTIEFHLFLSNIDRGDAKGQRLPVDFRKT